MFTPLDWMVHLEASRMSLSRTGQRRYALLAALKHAAGKGKDKAAGKPALPADTTPARCCEAAA